MLPTKTLHDKAAMQQVSCLCFRMEPLFPDWVISKTTRMHFSRLNNSDSYFSRSQRHLLLFYATSLAGGAGSKPCHREECFTVGHKAETQMGGI